MLLYDFTSQPLRLDVPQFHYGFPNLIGTVRAHQVLQPAVAWGPWDPKQVHLHSVKTAPVGAYAAINSKDTIVLNGYLMKYKYCESPMNNYSSTYFISTAMNDKDIWSKVKNGFAHYFLGRKIDIENEILTLNNPIRDSYYNIQPTKKTKKNQPNPNPQNVYIINRYYLSLKSDTLSLAPVNGPAGTLRFIRFANFY